MGGGDFMAALVVIGLFGFFGCLVWLIVAAIKKQKKRNSLIGIGVALVLFIVGAENSSSFQAGAQAGFSSAVTSYPGASTSTASPTAKASSMVGASQPAPSRTVSSNAPSAEPSAASEAQPKEIYNDKLITAWFVKKYDVSYMPSMFYFEIKVENKTNKKITVYPQDSYVNDTTFTALGAESMDILPNTDRTHTFFGPYEGTGIATANKIKKIGFKINITDENTHDVETTKTIEIKF